MDWRALEERVDREFRCECADRILRRRVKSNGAVAWVLQCIQCGAVSQEQSAAKFSPAEREAALPVDLDRQEWWQEQRREYRRGLLEQEQAETRLERLREHDAYLQSPAWKQKRNLRLERDRYQCQARMQGCLERATQVHHLSYERWGDEPLWDLVSVCRSCHNRLHPHLQEAAEALAGERAA